MLSGGWGIELQNFIMALLSQLLPRLPILLVLTVGLALVAIRPVSNSSRTLGIAGFGLLLLLQLVSTVLWAVLAGMPGPGLGLYSSTAMKLFPFVFGLLEATGVGLLALALMRLRQ